MPELSEYSPRIVEYLLDHHYDDHTHLFQIEWHADLDFALDWLRRQEEHHALALIATAWLEGHEEREMAVAFNTSVELVREHRVRLCHVLADWLNGCS